MEAATLTGDGRVDLPGVEEESPHLKGDSMGFFGAVIIGLTSVAPPYSVAAILAFLVAETGVKAPGVLLVTFIPMGLIAMSFLYLSRIDADCGTTYTWVRRAFGPWFGWIAGWAVILTGLLTIGSFADTAMYYLYDLIGLGSWAESNVVVALSAIFCVGALTWLGVKGTEGSVKFQQAMALFQLIALSLFVVLAFVKVFGSNPPENSVKPELSWLNPFGLDSGALTAGMLLSVFAYWGWESTVNLSEETKDGSHNNGRAAVVSTIILLAIYVSVTMASVALFGAKDLAKGEDATIFSTVAEVAGGGVLGTMISLSVIIAALATTQTTIIPASRTVLSMGRSGAMPDILSRIDPRSLTPAVAMWAVAIAAAVIYALLKLINSGALADAFYGATIAIAFYYAMNGYACLFFLRKTFKGNPKRFLVAGVAPTIGAVILTVILALQFKELLAPDYSSVQVFGLGLSLVFAVGVFVLGTAGAILWRLYGTKSYWANRPETAPANAFELAEETH